MDPLTASPIAKIATEVAAKGFATLLGELIKQAFKPSEKKTDSIDAPDAFHDHLSTTFERCTKVKTLISRDEPVELLHQYVNVNFTYVEKAEIKSTDDYELIERLRTNKRGAVVGTAGTGKTIFMKYLWLSCFVDPRGRIPIFLELRRLNELTSPNILSYIFHNIMMMGDDKNMTAFFQAVADGKFILLLDGFDEVVLDKRKIIEQQILDLSQRFRDLIIIVSSRPDDRVNSWQDFYKYQVAPMKK